MEGEGLGQRWVSEAAARCVLYVGEEIRVAGTLNLAIAALSCVGPLLQVARRESLRDGKPTEAVDALLAMQPLFDEGAREIALQGNHTIHRNGALGIWAAVEVAVEDTAIAVLVNDPNVGVSIANAGYRLPGNANAPSTRSEARRWYSRLERQTRNGKTVLRGYETLLNTLGVPLSCPAEMDNLMGEFNYVRNCILHRGGLADEDAQTEAPALLVAPGQAIRIDQARYMRYFDIAGQFSQELLRATIASSHINTPRAS